MKIASELLKIAKLLTAKYKVEKWYFMRMPRGRMRQKQVRWTLSVDLDWSDEAHGKHPSQDYKEKEMLEETYRSDKSTIRTFAKIGRNIITIPGDFELRMKFEIKVPMDKTNEATRKLEALGYKRL